MLLKNTFRCPGVLIAAQQHLQEALEGIDKACEADGAPFSVNHPEDYIKAKANVGEFRFVQGYQLPQGTVVFACHEKNEIAVTMRLTIARVMIVFDITLYAYGMWCQIVMKSISYGDMNCHKAQG